MFKFLVKRLVYLLVSIPLVILVTLLLTKASPYDQVESKLDRGDFSFERNQYNQIYRETARLYNLDLPLFYLSIKSSNYTPAYFTKIVPQEKAFYRRYLQESFSFSTIDLFYKQVLDTHNEISKQTDKGRVRELIRAIEFAENEDQLQDAMEALEKEDNDIFGVISSTYENMLMSRSRASKLLPKVMWHGLENQFHQNFLKVITLSFGKSFSDGQQVTTKVAHAFAITLVMILMSFLLTYPFSIWLGRQLALYEKKPWAKWIEGVLFAMASIALFWVATLALIFFTTPEYAQALNLFPIVSSYDFSMVNGFWCSIFRNIQQLILPTLCVSLTSIAYVARQTKSLIKAELDNRPYITTVAMKGLSTKKIVLKHAFLNTKLQLVTMVSSGLVGALSGGIIIEYIFNIPGVGRLLLDSIIYMDWPVILCVVLLLFVLSTLIVSLSDIVYMSIDPRVKIESDG